MSNSQTKKILATINAESFVGRTRELEFLHKHASGAAEKSAALLLHAPAGGASELLKQTYDRIFYEAEETIPFYFAVRESDKTAATCARRFLQTFLAQTVAFRLLEPQLLAFELDFDELAELARPQDKEWLKRLIQIAQDDAGDERAFVRSCLSATQRAANYGAKALVMIDDLHETEFLSGGVDFFDEIKQIFSRSAQPFVLAGRRRFLLSRAQTGATTLSGAEILKVNELNFSDAGVLAEKLATEKDLEISDAARDLIARQFDGNPTLIRFLFEAASAKRVNLDSFQAIETVYSDELFGGRIEKFYDQALRRIVQTVEQREKIVELLFEAQRATLEVKSFDAAEFQRIVNLSERETERVMRLLNWHEIVNLSGNRLRAATQNEILNDYIAAKYRLGEAGETRAATVGEMSADFLKRAPKLMARFYRQQSAIGLREILSKFNNQELPAEMLDYAIYKDESVTENSEKIRLPQIIYTAQTAAFYPPFHQIAADASSAVALGFETGSYADSDETVWLAAEIESKLEASRETTEFWCDRLEIIALTRNFPKYKLWLVAPAGFAPDALETLRERNAYGSSREQAERLKRFLDAKETSETEKAAEEYEFVVPMGDDTEIIAVHAVEDIARRQEFDAKSINQIKTALVEACINATEHSLSLDRKIHLKFTVEADKLTISVANRGLRLIDRMPVEAETAEKRRGWGLKLMRSLMDEVRIEPVDDGTRILMTKLIKSETRTQ